jgi:hypothetical protein
MSRQERVGWEAQERIAALMGRANRVAVGRLHARWFAWS